MAPFSGAISIEATVPQSLFPVQPPSQPYAAETPGGNCVDEVGIYIKGLVPDVVGIRFVDKNDHAGKKTSQQHIAKAGAAPAREDPAEQPYHDDGAYQSASHIHIHFVHVTVE